MKREPLVVGQVYHVFTKSIAGFKMFNNDNEFSRMTELIRYYQREKPQLKYSRFIELPNEEVKSNSDISNWSQEKLAEIIAYCIMPTHLHLILKQLKENGISIFMSNALNSYTRYFNIKHNRKGPLWEGRFKNVLIKTDEQLLHLTRYIHLNPVTAYLVSRSEDWQATSYHEYLLKVNGNDRICDYDKILDIEPTSYRKFVEDRVSYQRELAGIKEFLLEEYYNSPPLNSTP